MIITSVLEAILRGKCIGSMGACLSKCPQQIKLFFPFIFAFVKLAFITSPEVSMELGP